MQLVDRVSQRLKLRDLRLLDAVVRWKSMARAATQLNVTQPAVSKAIAEMEHTLGVRLLDRSRQGIEPTQYGRARYRRGARFRFRSIRQARGAGRHRASERAILFAEYADRAARARRAAADRRR